MQKWTISGRISSSDLLRYYSVILLNITRDYEILLFEKRNCKKKKPFNNKPWIFLETSKNVKHCIANVQSCKTDVSCPKAVIHFKCPLVHWYLKVVCGH